MAASRLEDLPLQRGAITGAIAFVVGSFFVFSLLILAGSPLSDRALSLPVSMTTSSYMTFHAWPVLLGGPPTFLLFSTLPAVILFAAGYTIAAASSASSRGGPARGATVAVGYLALTGLSIVFIVWRQRMLASAPTTPGDIQATILAFAFVFAGLVFPVVFGGLGGMLAERRGH